MAENLSRFRIISGSSHKLFADKVAERLLMKVTDVKVGRHSDNETSFEIIESIREKHVFIIQSKNNKTNDNIMELLIMIHTCKLASSARITAVITYFPYSRRDKKMKPRAPITAKLLANLLETAGADHIMTMDLHAPQIQGFFNKPVDNLFAEPSIIKYIKQCIPDWKNSIIVSPDAGGTKRVTSIASKLDLEIAIIHRPRNKSNSVTLIGNVNQKVAIIVDDMADTCETLIIAAQKLKQSNPLRIYAIVTHGILSGNGYERINSSDLDKLVVTNTLPQDINEKNCQKLDVIDVSPVFAEAIRRISNGESVSYLFSNVPTE